MSREINKGIYRKHSNTSISDIENYENEDYLNAIKKLYNDKASLKDKLKKLLKQYDDKEQEHKSEITKSKQYYQNHINQLEVEKISLKTIYDREMNNIKKDYEDKFIFLDKKYSNFSTTTEINIKSLEKILEEKEKKLNLISQEYEMKETQLKEQTKKILDLQTKERNELIKKMIEKENETNEFKKQLEDNLKLLAFERETQVKNTQNIKDSYEKKKKQDEKNLEENKLFLKIEKDSLKKEYQTNLEDIISMTNKKLTENKQQCDFKLLDIERLNEIKIKNMEDDHKRNLENSLYQNSQKLNLIAIEYENKLKELNNENLKLSSQIKLLKKEAEEVKNDNEKQLEKIKNTLDNEKQCIIINYEKKISENNQKYEKTISENTREYETNKNKYNEIINKLNCEIKEAKSNYQTTVDNLKIENEKIKGESQDKILEKTQQITQLKDNIKKLQENFENLNNLNINNSNKQKELYDKEIVKRDDIIIHFERKVKLLTSESLDKISFLERKINNINQEYEIINCKNIEYKSIIEKAEQNMSILKCEILVNHEEKERYIEKLKILDDSQGKMELKFIELKNKEYEYIRMKDQVQKLSLSETKIKEELSRIVDELNFVKTDNDKKTRAYDAMKNNFSKISLKLSQDIKAKEEIIEQLKKQQTELENKSEIKRLKEYIEFLEKYKEEGIEKSCIELKKYEENLEKYENNIIQLKQVIETQKNVIDCNKGIIEDLEKQKTEKGIIEDLEKQKTEKIHL